MSYEPESLLKPFYKQYKNRTYNSDELNEFNNFTNQIFLHINKNKLLNPDAFKESAIAYEVGKDSGFFYIPNPFNNETILKLAIDALIKWPNNTNRMNVDIEKDRPNDIWLATLDELKNGKKLSESWLYKLRWTSMGYHYQWTDRIYKEDCHSDIPNNLSIIMKDIVSILGWPEYFPEAAIVNYYHLNSAMCFHQDHSEFAKDVPLVSISIGQSGVYLLGTNDPMATPVPIILNHGDVVVMTGASRLAYHAVPKIVKVEDEIFAKQILDADIDGVLEKLAKETGSNELAEIIWKYLRVNRININMRQVLESGKSFPLISKEL